jgi:hypothetical protein
MTTLPRSCLGCGATIPSGSRCAACHAAQERQRSTLDEMFTGVSGPHLFSRPTRGGSLFCSTEPNWVGAMTYRKLSRGIAVAALGAAAFMALPAPATAAQPVDEVGYVAEQCSGEADGYTVVVNLFQTSFLGGLFFADALIETPDGSTLVSAGFTHGPVLFADDGTIDALFDIVDETTQEPAGSATVSGTYAVSGNPTRVHEVINEGEQIVVTVGTNSPLSVDLTLEYADTTIALECQNAFAFDLMVLRQRIGTPA